MKQLLTAFFVAVLGVSLTVEDADAARRFGGGGNSGIQRSAPAKRDAAPAPAARPAQPAPQAAPNRWLAPIAGLAAGLGLFALFSYLGLGEELATFAMLLLLGLAAFFVIRLLLRKFRAHDQPVQYAGGPSARAHYDAPATDRNTGSGGVAGATRANGPADFDADSFLRHAKLNFVRLQAANDAADIDDIRQFTTPEMFAEIKLQMEERGGAPQKSDVIGLNAELIEVTTEFRQHIASVRFFGTIRAGEVAEPFDEIWHITKPVDDSRNWAIAGIQQADSTEK